MIRHLVLAGVGPGHFRFLQGLLKKRSADIAITVITRQLRTIAPAALLRAVAGRQPLDECGELIAPLLRQVNVNWLDHQVQALDPAARVLLMDDGRELRFDWLSLEPEPAHVREFIERDLPGARANGLFLRPLEAFCKLWPRVAEMAALSPLRVAVICGGAGGPAATVPATVPAALPVALPAALPAAVTAGDWPQEKFAIELALAVRQAFKGSAVTLITGGPPLAAQTSPALQRAIQQALKRCQVTVLTDAAIKLQSGEVMLQSGARLACDVPLLAVQAQPHALLAGSGLALNDAGDIDLDGAQRSTSHTPILACDSSAPAARRLAVSLQAVADGKTPAAPRQTLGPGRSGRDHKPGAGLQILRCGNGQRIVSFGPWAWRSRLLGAVIEWAAER